MISGHIWVLFDADNWIMIHQIGPTRVFASGGSRGGSKGLLEPPFETKLFQFHGDFSQNQCKSDKTNIPFCI